MLARLAPSRTLHLLPAVLCLVACGGSSGDDPEQGNPSIATGNASGPTDTSTNSGGDASGTGGNSTIGNGGTANTEPAWFADCDIGETVGACDIGGLLASQGVDAAPGDACMDVSASSGLTAENFCAAENILDESRCPTRDAVAVCITGGSRTTRNIYYIEPPEHVRAVASCCTPAGSTGTGGSGGAPPAGGRCAIAPGNTWQLGNECLSICIDDGNPDDTQGYCGSPCDTDADCENTALPSRCLLECMDNDAREDLVGNCLVQAMYDATVAACGD